MEINLTKGYKSLQPFSVKALPNFVVITGLNGAGKTQFLEILREPKSEGLLDVTNPKISIAERSYLYFGSAQFNPTGNGRNGFNEDYYFRLVNEKYGFYRNISKELYPLFDFIYENGIEIERISRSSLDSLGNKEKFEELMPSSIPMWKSRSFHSSLTGLSNWEILRVLFNEMVEKNVHVIFKRIIKFNEIKFSDIEEDHFKKTPFNEYALNIGDFESLKIENIFYSYYHRRNNNKIAHWYKAGGYYENDSVPDSVFAEENTPPWELLNRFFIQNNLPFEFRAPSFDKFHPHTGISFSFYHKKFDTEIKFNQVSSGERKIISLLLMKYNIKTYGTKIKKPKLMLLDEPDLGLHPDVLKLLIDTLMDEFIEQLDIKVIMTTHSPTAIALSPEESLYEIKNGSQSSLKSVTKDYALNLLTGKIPNLSIDYKNHRQVFVESPYDLEYYQKLNDVLSTEYRYTYKLYFMTHQLGKGDCNQVKHAVERLSDSGMNTCYGIIDWDKKNITSEKIIVHGERVRYSIENFLCDPLFIAMLFLKENGANNIYSELGFSDHYNYGNLANENEERLQEVCNWVIEKVKTQKPMYKLSDETTEFKYINGKKIVVPVWYAETQGHELEKDVINSFDSLKNRYSSAPQRLKSVLIKVILGSIGYGLIPLETKELLERIGN